MEWFGNGIKRWARVFEVKRVIQETMKGGGKWLDQ
jgi:hypothetical protein